MSYEIEWVGNQYTNKSSRKGFKPIAIVDHISEGSEISVLSWGRSSGNNVSSWHFFITRKGKIYQFVKIEDMAWVNGLRLNQIPKAKAKIVRENGVNPNLYTVGIEHEGIYEETHGQLTQEQFKATVWLHKYIREYVQKKWGYLIPANREHILGHYEIDPVRKPNCPGEKYPFEELIKELNGGNGMEENKQVPQWQKDALKKLVDAKVINTPEYWENKLGEGITVGEALGIIANLVK